MYNGTICSSDITINHLLARHVSSNYEKTARVQVFWELPRDADHQTFCLPDVTILFCNNLQVL